LGDKVGEGWYIRDDVSDPLNIIRWADRSPTPTLELV
jgi:hypothetical protein